MGKIFYIADNHFGHEKIIEYDRRRFDSVGQMDALMIQRWNEVVSDEDTVYVIGDLSFYKEERTLSILHSLAGEKVLIQGNHDRVSPRVAKCYVKREKYLEIMDGSERVVMCHYPMPFWNGQFKDTVHLYGHVHNSEQAAMCEEFKRTIRERQNIPVRMFNVGAMLPYMDYYPRTLNHILKEAEKYGIVRN